MDLAQQLERFLEPQRQGYDTALREIRSGRKCSHWMWYIFPQLRGLGKSTMAQYYAIADLAEAKAYLEHPILGQRIREITGAVLALPESDPMQIFGWPDNLKFRSCMTLFAQVCPDDLFDRALDKFFGGQADSVTLGILAKM